MELKGLIHSVDLKNKIISIVHNRTLKFFYFQNNLMKKFKKYLYAGNCISLVAEDSKEAKGRRYVHTVIYVNEIFVPTMTGRRFLYNKEMINKSLIEFFDSLNYKLFIDIEMTMPGYNSSNFVSEIIQAGFFVVNKKGEIVEKYNYHIRPTKIVRINRRTRDFLHLTNEDLKKSVSYYKFYNKFKQLLIKYKPAILTFGKNDKLFLERSYNINELPSLNYISRYINLAQLIKNYYELKIDPGLFNLYEQYTGIKNVQTHDALEDAIITYDIYRFFINDMKENFEKEGEVLRISG